MVLYKFIRPILGKYSQSVILSILDTFLSEEARGGRAAESRVIVVIANKATHLGVNSIKGLTVGFELGFPTRFATVKVWVYPVCGIQRPWSQTRFRPSPFQHI